MLEIALGGGCDESSHSSKNKMKFLLDHIDWTYITRSSAILFKWVSSPQSDNGRAATKSSNFTKTKYHVKDSKLVEWKWHVLTKSYERRRVTCLAAFTRSALGCLGCTGNLNWRSISLECTDSIESDIHKALSINWSSPYLHKHQSRFRSQPLPPTSS